MNDIFAPEYIYALTPEQRIERLTPLQAEWGFRLHELDTCPDIREFFGFKPSFERWLQELPMQADVIQ